MTPPPPGRRSAPRRVQKRWAVLTTGSAPERLSLASLFLLATLVGVLVEAFPDQVSFSALAVPMVIGSLFLGPRALPWYVVYCLVLTTVALPKVPAFSARTVSTTAVVFLLAFILMLISFRRSRLGVAGIMGESMLVDLSDRIQGQGVLPSLPAPWHAESVIRSAGGTRFAGDFIVVGDVECGRLDVTVVDVSGKGDRAGARALLLAGAMGGLVTAVEPAQFLPAANTYLINHPWQDGFATAVHLSLDLRTGSFRVWTAGHPPALHWSAGAGRWVPVESEGPMLGLIPDVDFDLAVGTLRSGDAMMLYTDGMVETRTADIGIGIDRMIGQADQLLRSRFTGGAGKLVDAVGTRNDDRALLLVWRD